MIKATGVTFQAQGPPVHGRSSGQAAQESPCDEEQLPHGQFEGWSKESETGLRVSGNSRGGAGVEVEHGASIDRDDVALGVVRYAPETILATIFEDQGNRL